MQEDPRADSQPDQLSLQAYLVRCACQASQRAQEAEADLNRAKLGGDHKLVRIFERQIAQDLGMMNLARMLTRAPVVSSRVPPLPFFKRLLLAVKLLWSSDAER